MRRPRLVVGALTVLVASLLVAAVGCGGEGKVTPTAVPAALEEQLREMVLQLEDLPSGVVRVEEFFSTNELSAAASEDRDERLAMLEEWGRILGYEVTYQANPKVMEEVGLILANSTASLYGSEDGARASFADAVQTARTTDWTEMFGAAQGVEVEEVVSPPLANEMLWLRITAKAEVGEEPQEETFANDVLIFRQGAGRASLMVGWIMGRGSGDIMAQLAEAQAQRLKDALP